MGQTSGKTGAVSSGGTGLKSIVDWDASWDSTIAVGIASNTGGGEIATGGIRDWKGNFNSYGQDPVLVPGASSALILDSGASKLSGTGFASGISLDIDYENASYLKWKTSFEGSGALVPTSTSAATDVTSPGMAVPVGGKVTWAPIVTTLQSVADLPAPKSASFSMQTAIKAYVASGAAVRSKVAGNPTFSASVELWDDAWGAWTTTATTIQPGTQGILKLYVTATLFIGLTYATVESLTPRVNIETGDINGYGITFKGSAWAVISGVQTRGTFVTPGGTVLWV